ncbi:MAG: ROK family protein [Anaerolineales bacterium]|nr:ROK family protein [Anaerolineales bacterium]
MGSGNKVWGGIEAGGTKFVCAAGSGPDDIAALAKFPTTTPQETLSRVVDFFKQQSQVFDLQALGVASFGPVDLHPDSATYGFITSTPKPGWKNTEVVGVLQREFGIPVGFDTDVNGAAHGEYRWGAARGLSTFIYLTVGTGIGGGVMVEGNLLHGLTHPETGHIYLSHDRNADPFEGVCPYHGDCFEGLASGPSMNKRWGKPAEELPADHQAWDLEADYISKALSIYVCCLSPQRIVLGGGVMKQQQLFPKVRRGVQEILNGYIVSPAIQENIDEYIVPPGLGDRAGVLGAIALAQKACP